MPSPRLRALGARLFALVLATCVALALPGCGGNKVDDATRQGAVSLQSAMSSATRGIDEVRPTRASLDNLAATLRDASDQTSDVIAVLGARTEDDAAAALVVAARKQRSYLESAQIAASDHSRKAALAAVAKARTAGGQAAEAYAAAAREFSGLAGVVPTESAFGIGRLRDAVSAGVKSTSTSSSSTTKEDSTSSKTSSSGASSGMSDCGAGISVNGATTCPFARNVASAFADSGGADVLDVWSPVTEQYYTMTCRGAMPTVCTGGNGARVEIR